MILGGNAASISWATTDNDWVQNTCGCNSNGALHQLGKKI